jgi:Phospholipase_D-nuclease N-terminal
MNTIQAFYLIWGGGNQPYFYSPYNDIFTLVVVILWIWAIISLLTSNASPPAKVLWLLLILILPIIGSILYFIIEPRGSV